MSKIIEHTSNGFKWLLVEVEPQWKGFTYHPAITDFEDEAPPMIDWEIDGIADVFDIKLPSPSWEIVGKADSLTEDQWKEIAKDLKEPAIGLVYYKDYTIHSRTDKIQFPCDTAKESGLTLLRSHGLNISETLILKSTQLLNT